MKIKKLINGAIGAVGMFAGVGMLAISTSGVSGTGKRFLVVGVGYLCVFLATIYFGKAVKKEKPENNDESYL